MSRVEELRLEVDYEPVVVPTQRPDVYDFLGETIDDQAIAIAHRVISPNNLQRSTIIENRLDIFRYIVHFLHRSTLEIPLLARVGKGRNLARHIFLAPSGPAQGEEFTFAEQYRWDTYFQNKTLVLIGAYELAIKQLQNLAYAYERFGRIPNALTTEFLSHPQPPLEALAVFDLLEAGVEAGEWSDEIMQVVEKDLFHEWWDVNSGRQNPRQTQELVDRFGDWISRYTSVHFHPLLVGCQDGKDHNWINATYGENYLPVQLNALIYGNVDLLSRYYEEYRPFEEKAETYRRIREETRQGFNRIFWVDNDPWTGFRNYSLIDDAPGSIYYYDLGTEVWPLLVGLATEEQAEILRQNITAKYAGEFGLAATNPEIISKEEFQIGLSVWEFQWEVNCWPPLMLVASKGLMRYSKDPSDSFMVDALEYQRRWVAWAEAEYRRSGGFHEKGPFSSKAPIQEGYYGVLRGFGWTIANYLESLKNLSFHEVLQV